MDDATQAAQAVARYLQTFTSNGGLRLRFRVKLKTVRQVVTEEASGDAGSTPAPTDRGYLYVEFTGPDTPVLLAHNGEVLHALEHVATKILRLEAEDHDRVSFDADQFKAKRERQMRGWAEAGIERVRTTGRPHAFPPMSSRERRTLHMMLVESGLPTASSGEGPGRFVVLYPEGADTSVPMEAQVRRRDAGEERRGFRGR